MGQPEQLTIAIALAFALGGCVTTHGKVEGLEPVCEALIGPIKYNSTKTSSPRHAGSELAKDLKQRNQVGERLGCPAYKDRG